MFNKFKNTFLILAAVFKAANAITTIDHCIEPAQIALTFNDGPSIEFTNKILDILDEKNVKATFFISGEDCELNDNEEAKKIIQREFDSGHVIASHTYSHPVGITGLTSEQLKEDINKLGDAIYDIIGEKPAFFRPPHGDYNDESLKVLEECNLTANILWNLDFEDWNNGGQDSYEQRIKIIDDLDPHSNSFITLNHDTEGHVLENLKKIIDYGKKNGYKFVTMSECTGMEPYQPDPVSDDETLVKRKHDTNSDDEENDGGDDSNTDDNNNDLQNEYSGEEEIDGDEPVDNNDDNNDDNSANENDDNNDDDDDDNNDDNNNDNDINSTDEDGDNNDNNDDDNNDDQGNNSADENGDNNDNNNDDNDDQDNNSADENGDDNNDDNNDNNNDDYDDQGNNSADENGDNNGNNKSNNNGNNGDNNDDQGFYSADENGDKYGDQGINSSDDETSSNNGSNKDNNNISYEEIESSDDENPGVNIHNIHHNQDESYDNEENEAPIEGQNQNAPSRGASINNNIINPGNSTLKGMKGNSETNGFTKINSLNSTLLVLLLSFIYFLF